MNTAPPQEAPPEGYVLTVLAELADRTERYATKLQDRLDAAAGVRQSITETMDRLVAARTRLKQTRADVSQQLLIRDNAHGRASEANAIIDRATRRIAELNAMMEYGIEDEQVFAELGRAGKAKEEKTAERDKWRLKADEAQKKADQGEDLMKEIAVEVESRAIEIKALQKDLPDPHLFSWLALAHFGRANANYLLSPDPNKFARMVRSGVASIRTMHQELREGRYRLDRYGDLLAGRHEATVQAIFGAVAIGDMKLAQEVFSLAADPGMFFHQIFNVFRVWSLGAFLLGDTPVIQRLIRDHRFEKKLWGGYVRCFRAIAMTGNEREFNVGLQQILKFETRPDDLDRIPGVSLIHLPAVALCRLAQRRRIAIHLKDRRLPPALIKW
ncbi:MAG: hypothetical protein IT381_23935 [Deltaproteobacteria bacterium]|nr:hypothetical protein [Deltaproteobacteria bacterium]